MAIRGVRGAITVDADNAKLILDATRELLETILKVNPDIKPEDIASVIFTMSPDLSATFPAEATRRMNWGLVPMLCAREIAVPGSLQRVIRVLVHWNTDHPQSGITHVYLRDAVRLRPDLVSAQ